MKVISKSPDILDLRSSPISISFFVISFSLLFLIIGSPLFGLALGLLFITSLTVVTSTFDKKVGLVTIKRQALLGYLLNVSRENPLEPQDEDSLSKYRLRARIIQYPLNEVQEAVVETKHAIDEDSQDTYRIELRLLSGEQVPLRSSYDSGKSEKEKAVEEINSWLSEEQPIGQGCDERLQEVTVSAEVVHRQADSEREPLITASVTEVPVTASVVSPSIKPLSAKNPLDHLRLLWWTLVTPQQLKAYREQFGQTAERPTAKWLASTLLWLPFFLPFLAIGLKIVPLPHSESPFIATHYLWASGGLLIAWLLTAVFGDRTYRRVAEVLALFRDRGGLMEKTVMIMMKLAWEQIKFSLLILPAAILMFVVTFGLTAVGVSEELAVGIGFVLFFAFLFHWTIGLSFMLEIVLFLGLVALSSGVLAAGLVSGLTPLLGVGLLLVLSGVLGLGLAVGLPAGLVFVLTGVLAAGSAGVLAGGMAGVQAGILAGVLAFGLAVGLLAALGKAIEKSLETGHPSFVARGAFGLLVAAYGFLVWCSYLGGWRWWIPQ